jgi:soluble lytic murein transglycosylase-like protein
MTRAELVSLAKQTAEAHQLFPHLVCGITEHESSWNPWAYKYEPAFFSRYVEPIFNDGKITVTEAHGRAISWGLGQVMGQSARELGYADWLPMLCDPATGLEWLCRMFARNLQHAEGNTLKALSLYNGGGDPTYPGVVMGLAAKYQ